MFFFPLIRYVNGSHKCSSTISNLKTSLFKTTVCNITYWSSWLTDFTPWREGKIFRSHYKPRDFNVFHFASYFRYWTTLISCFTPESIMTTCGHIHKIIVKSCKIHVRITKRVVTILVFSTCYVFESREIKVGYIKK
jgi:magnesium-transporting ATPase (P-type)